MTLPAPTNDTLKQDKKKLRKAVMQRTGSLEDAYKVSADAKIRRNLTSLPEYQAAHTVFCFVSTAEEIDTFPLLTQMLLEGKRLVVPLCLSRGIMQARQITDLSQLAPGYYGIPEPAQDTPCVLPEQIDFAVIPCVSCSHTGARLGHGGGFYDIYFSQNPHIPTAMICREQIITEDIPREPHDLIFPLVVTEAGIFRNEGYRP